MITKSSVLSKNMLFASLDSTIRKGYVKGFNFTFIDTVGFINRTIVVTDNGDMLLGSTWEGMGFTHWNSSVPGVIQHTFVDTFGVFHCKVGINNVVYYSLLSCFTTYFPFSLFVHTLVLSENDIYLKQPTLNVFLI